jgi:hypothetical protein
MAESLLDALEKSLRIFEKHRIFLLGVNSSASAMPPRHVATSRSLPRGNIQHTVRYTELAPDRFKDFWR